MYLFYFLAVVGLNCCPWAFSSYSEPGLLFIAELRLLITLASLGAEHGLWGARASVVVALGLISCRSRALEHRLNSCGAPA